MRHWLMKSEPSVFSIDDLAAAPGRRDSWDGVRNHQARNFMREMAPGDLAVFYHSNADPPGAAGVCRVVRGARPDPSQWDRSSGHFDPRSSRDAPRWDMVDVEFVEKFPRLVPLAELRARGSLADTLLVRKGNRLSVMPLLARHFRAIREMGLG